VAPKYLFRWSFAGDGCFRSGWQSLAVSRGIVFYTTSTEKPAVRAEIKVIDAEDVWVSFLGSMKP